MDSEYLKLAHKHCKKNREEVLGSYICGCFFCLNDFYPEEITTWWDDDVQGVGQTAVCPKCGIDSVIGSGSGFPIDQEFLGKMKEYWF